MSIGAVLADRRGKLVHYFGHAVSPAIVRTWGRPDQVQRVFEAKFYCCMLVGLGDTSEACLCLCFVDNEAAKACWIAVFARPVTPPKRSSTMAR